MIEQRVAVNKIITCLFEGEVFVSHRRTPRQFLRWIMRILFYYTTPLPAWLNDFAYLFDIMIMSCIYSQESGLGLSRDEILRRGSVVFILAL